jgi:hypothetical protein
MIDGLNLRNNVIHVKKIFNSADLKLLRKIFLKLKKIEKNTEQSCFSEKEKMAIERGETSNKIRQNKIFFKIFKKNKKKIINTLFPYNYIMYPPNMRIVGKKKNIVPWHQDKAYMKLLGKRAPKKIITCFVPLNNYPWKCSTLEFAVNEKNILHKHKKMHSFNCGIKKKFLNIKSFKLKLGDVLIFDDRIPHRTKFLNKSVENRISIEFRITTPKYITKNKDFYDIEKSKFVRKK